MDQRIDKTIDGWTKGWTNEWLMSLSCTDAIDASENDDFLTDFSIFTKALWTDAPSDQCTNGLMDQQTYPLIEM